MPPSATGWCIDPWQRNSWIIDLVEKPQKVERPFSVDAFRHYTRDCPNIKTIQGYSPDVVAKTWSTPVDLFFDDSDHEEPGLSRNRDFWAKWLKPGGTFCGDEYSSDFPACLRKTYQLAMEWNATVSHAGLFWWMRKPATSLASGAQDAARATH